MGSAVTNTERIDREVRRQLGVDPNDAVPAPADGVCAVPTCPALRVERLSRCAVHSKYGRRVAKGIAIRCYACGARLRLGRPFVVKAEGAFHVRSVCSNASPSSYAIPVLS